jgi:hypothetical protein
MDLREIQATLGIRLFSQYSTMEIKVAKVSQAGRDLLDPRENLVLMDLMDSQDSQV